MARGVANAGKCLMPDGRFIITGVPSSTLKALIDGYRSAGTVFEELYWVSLSYSANWEFDLTADGAIPDGLLVKATPCNGSPYYYLDVDLISYTDQNGNVKIPTRIIQVWHDTGTLALHDTIYTNLTAGKVDDAGASGIGSVAATAVKGTGYAEVIL